MHENKKQIIDIADFSSELLSCGIISFPSQFHFHLLFRFQLICQSVLLPNFVLSGRYLEVLAITFNATVMVRVCRAEQRTETDWDVKWEKVQLPFRLGHKSLYPKKVRIVEVGPRDGLQNEPTVVLAADKVEFINRLSQTGLQTIEVTR